MADEKKPQITTATANSPAEWIGAYYSDDAIDYSKKNKIRHIIRINQFASVAFIVSKNTKKAHTDFFESNYTALDTTYAKAAELIIRLLSVKYGESRALTADDFENCGGKALFGDRPNYAQICDDYIGSGGMVEMCESAFPTPKGEELKRDNESYVGFNEWYKNASDYEKQERYQEKMKSLYGSFVDDMENVKADHMQVLSLASADERKSGVLSGDTLHKIYRTATDSGAKMQREWKGKKSAIDFTIRDDIEKTYELGYETVKKTAKVAALGGVAAASLGAVVGGVFWPAFMLVPVYALAKKWLPDWTKSLGKMWGHIEKSIGNRFQKQKIDSYYHYIVSFMETGGKPKLRFKDRFFLTPGVIKTLKKGAKSGSVSSTFEGTDEKTHKSEIDLAEAKTSMVMGNLLNAGDADGLVPADKQALLLSNIEKINKGTAAISQFAELASRFNAWKDGLPGDAKYAVPIKYADKLDECLVKLIFETPMEDIKYISDVVNVALADDGTIVGMIKEIVPQHPVIPKLSRLRMFANKEITGLSEAWKGKTLREYIERDGMALLGDTELDASGFVNPTDAHLIDALSYIKNLIRDPKNEKEVIVNGTTIKLKQINETIADIANGRDRDTCSKLLQEQMTKIFYNELRVDAKATLGALTDGTFTGKMVDISKFFDKMSEMTYENIDSKEFSQLVFDVTGPTKISPPEVGNYLRTKLGQTARDKFIVYINQDGTKMKFTEDLPSLIEYLRKINNCSLLNEQQKVALTADAKIYVNSAFDRFVKNMSGDFVGKFNEETIRKYLEDEYSSNGLKTLFASDNSAEVKEIKDKLTNLRLMKDIQSNLQFNKRDMDTTDKAIISKILLRDEDSRFDNVKVRDSSDDLVKFLSSQLKVSKSYEKSKLATCTPADIGNAIHGSGSEVTPYYQLKEKLAQIDSLTSKYDKYAAIVALKNQAIYQFRECLVTVAYTFGSGNVNNWLTTDNGIAMYDAAIAAWTGEGCLFSQIDEKLDAIHGSLDARYGINRSKLLSESEAKRYTGTYTLSLSEEQSLGS